MRAMDLALPRTLRAADFKNWEFSSGHRMTTEGQNRSIRAWPISVDLLNGTGCTKDGTIAPSGPLDWNNLRAKC